MVFKKLQNKILVHMKTFHKPQIRVLDHLLSREKHLSVFFRTVFSSDFLIPELVTEIEKVTDKTSTELSL